MIDLALTALRNSERTKPFTLVLDISTTLFFHDEISSLLQHPQILEGLQNKELVIVTTCSLAKYPMVGLDKFTGGTIQVYGHQDPCKKLIRKFRILSVMDPISEEAEKFLNLLFSTSQKELLQYFNHIRSNTQFLYSQLTELQSSETPLKIGRRDEGVMMLGIHFDYPIEGLEEDKTDSLKACLTLLVQYYFYAKCAAQDLPLSIRSSFGFPTSTIIECHTALRMTVGLEDEEMLKAYASILAQINDEMKAALKDKQFGESLLTLMANEEFNEILLQRQVYIVEQAKQTSFAEFVEKIEELLS